MIILNILLGAVVIAHCLNLYLKKPSEIAESENNDDEFDIFISDYSTEFIANLSTMELLNLIYKNIEIDENLFRENLTTFELMVIEELGYRLTVPVDMQEYSEIMELFSKIKKLSYEYENESQYDNMVGG